MADLTDAQIRTLRKDWLGDYIDEHPEWGGSPTVRVSAAVGAATLSLQGLGVGTVNRGTPFVHYGEGIRRDTYTVMESASIVSGFVVVSIQPLLAAKATVGDVVKPEPIYRSTFNKRNHRLFFDDSELQDLAVRADARWTRRIASSRDPIEMWFRGIELLALERMLSSGSEYTDAVLADDARGNAKQHLDNLRATADRDRAILDTDQRGFRTTRLFR